MQSLCTLPPGYNSADAPSSLSCQLVGMETIFREIETSFSRITHESGTGGASFDSFTRCRMRLDRRMHDKHPPGLPAVGASLGPPASGPGSSCKGQSHLQYHALGPDSGPWDADLRRVAAVTAACWVKLAAAYLCKTSAKHRSLPAARCSYPDPASRSRVSAARNWWSPSTRLSRLTLTCVTRSAVGQQLASSF